MDPDRQDTERQELRRWLAKRLKWDDIPEPLWEVLDLDVEGVLSPNDPLDRKEFLDLARERIRFAKDMAPFVGADARPPGNVKDPGPQKKSRRREMYRETSVFDPALDPLAEAAQSVVSSGFSLDDLGEERRKIFEELLARQRSLQERQSPVPADDPVLQRAQAFSLYLAKVANEDPEVQRFRKEVLQGGRLSADQAECFMHSPAAAVLPISFFEDNNVPVAEHTAEILDLSRIDSGWSRRVKGQVRVRWGENEIVTTFEGTVLPSDPFDRGIVNSEPVRALRGSLISDLLAVQERLCERFPWRPQHSGVLEVPMFILTGKVPKVEPLRAVLPERYSNLYQTVDITVWPWVPVEDVTALYERARKELSPTPNTSPRRLALFMFVMQQPDVHVQGGGARPEVPPWRELMNLWNQQCPWRELHPDEEWHYTDVRNFKRGFDQAFDQIVNFYRSDEWFPESEASTEPGRSRAEDDADDPEDYETEFNW
jgi:hypothetical protein